MKTRRGIVPILFAAGILFFSTFLQSPAVHAGGMVYDSSQTYTGTYISSRLYYSDTVKGYDREWELGDLAGPAAVTCPEARKQLLEKGVWRGRLRRNGSCSEDAPFRIWGLGNWLNFEKSIPIRG